MDAERLSTDEITEHKAGTNMVMRIVMEHDDDLSHALPEELERPISDYPWFATNGTIKDAHGNLIAECQYEGEGNALEGLRGNAQLMAQAPHLAEAVLNAAAIFRRYEAISRKKKDIEQMRHNRIYAEKLEEIVTVAIGKKPNPEVEK